MSNDKSQPMIYTKCLKGKHWQCNHRADCECYCHNIKPISPAEEHRDHTEKIMQILRGKV